MGAAPGVANTTCAAISLEPPLKPSDVFTKPRPEPPAVPYDPEHYPEVERRHPDAAGPRGLAPDTPPVTDTRRDQLRGLDPMHWVPLAKPMMTSALALKAELEAHG